MQNIISYFCAILCYASPFCISNMDYEKSNLKDATHFGITGIDNSYTTVEAIDLDLPKINSSNILLFFKSNLYSYKTKSFQYKNFSYAYSANTKSFDAIIFEINATLDILSRKFLNGLTVKEAIYQKSLYGSCQLNINIDSYFELIKKEFKDPFYIFQIFSIILWMLNQYVNYAIIILIITIISVFISITETKRNLLNIKEMIKLESEVTIYRNEVKLRIYIFSLFIENWSINY